MSSTRQKLDRLFSSPRPGKEPTKINRAKPPPDASKSSDSLHKLEREVLGAAAAADASLSVKDRLERLVAVTTSRPRKVQPDEPRVVRRSLDDVENGEEVQNDLGRFYCVENVYPLEHYQGRMPLSRLRDVAPEAFSLLARGDDTFEMSLERALFLDTETTGLAGGSGTCPFLIGLGYVSGDAFVVRQLFMRSYDEEAAMLHYLGEQLAEFDVLVSYNGKTYDIPLLETRFVLTRQRLSFENMLHFDLLHPARSLWKARVESCRLMELEHRLLGLARGEDDVPGHMIPQLYFSYLRSGNAARMANVFHHNRHDILSLAALAIAASDMLDEEHVPDDPLDDVSLGRLFERSQQSDRSMLHYSRAVEAGIQGAPRRRALRALADQHKRRGDVGEARKLWEELASGRSQEGVYALHELAMVMEHHHQDFDAAVEHCDRALSELEDNYEWTLAFRTRWTEAFQHRRRRLIRRSKR